MRLILLVSACLSCVGHGWRLHTRNSRLQGEDVTSVQSRSELKQLRPERQDAEIEHINLLVLLLLAVHPAAGWAECRVAGAWNTVPGARIPRSPTLCADATLPLEPDKLPPELAKNPIVRSLLRWHKDESNTTFTHTVTENEDGERLVKVAALAFDNLGSSRQAYVAAKRGSLLINGEAVETSRRVWKDDLLTLQVEAKQMYNLKRLRALSRRFVPVMRNFGLRVKYEDDDIAVVFKPPRVHVKTGQDPKHFALEDALPAELTPPPPGSAALPLPMAVHRLDFQVSGLCVIAKTRAGLLSLGRQFEERTVSKTYHALLAGTVCKGKRLIEAPVDGRWAKTEVELLSVVPSVEWGNLSSVRLWPHTGRTHQLRVHAAEVLGCPIVGDELYWDTAAQVQLANGGELPAFRQLKTGGLFLQSCGVRFEHPNGSLIHVIVPETRKFSKLRKHALKVSEWTRRKQMATTTA